MGRYADKLLRVCIGIIAFLFWVVVACLLYAVYFIIITYKSYHPFFHDRYILLPTCVASTGAAFLLLNGLMGCSISKKGSRCQQGTFMYFIVVVLCLEASAALLAFVYKNRMDSELSPMQNVFAEYNGSKPDSAVDKLQKELYCCGLNNYTDWQTTNWYKQNFSLPKSCCNVTFPSCFGNITDPKEFYQEGCFVKLQHKLNYYMSWLFWSCIVVLVEEVLAAISDGVLMIRNPFQDFRILDSATFT